MGHSFCFGSQLISWFPSWSYLTAARSCVLEAFLFPGWAPETPLSSLRARSEGKLLQIEGLSECLCVPVGQSSPQSPHCHSAPRCRVTSRSCVSHCCWAWTTARTPWWKLLLPVPWESTSSSRASGRSEPAHFPLLSCFIMGLMSHEMWNVDFFEINYLYFWSVVYLYFLTGSRSAFAFRVRAESVQGGEAEVRGKGGRSGSSQALRDGSWSG